MLERRVRGLARGDGAILVSHFPPVGAALLGALCSAPLADAPPWSLKPRLYRQAPPPAWPGPRSESRSLPTRAWERRAAWGAMVVSRGDLSEVPL